MLKKVISISLVLIWCIIIFFFSSQTGTSSKENSDVIVNKITKILSISEQKKDQVSYIVRKSGHFFEYFILALLVANMFNCFNININKILIFTIFVSMIYASTDEIHQYFISNRTASIKDVILDTSASTIGTLIYYFIMRKKYEKNN